MTRLNVTVWGENLHEQRNPAVAKIYPQGMHRCIADALNEDPSLAATTATLDQPEHGLTEAVLAKTDVLTWWGHLGHGQVQDVIVDRVQKRVLEGMGLIVLHSGHHAKIFKRLLGTGCDLHWREAAERERVWLCNPGHAIAQGIEGDSFVIDHEEMYGEPFGIPNPDEVVFLSWFQGGEVFRSGVTYRRGAGKIFYFRPGHETYPTYHQPVVRRIIRNAVHWARPEGRYPLGCLHVPSSRTYEPLKP